MKVINWLKNNYWLTAILVVAAGLRFYRADFQSLWLDEVLSMNDANPKLTFKQFYDSVIFWEDLPHLYFFLLKIWVYIFGFTSMAARIFSAFIGIAGVYSMYLLGKELISKQGGLVAAGLACINVFHIAYSQEVRPYGMFLLFTVLAFYRLSILIRKPTYKNAIFFGIFAGLVINAHFVGLTVLFAQCLILLFFLILVPSNERKQFFICCCLSGVVAVLLILPNYEAFAQLAEIKSFWIPKPGPDSIALMVKEFFNNSEMLLFIVNILVVYYFVALFRQKMPETTYRDIIGNKMIFSFIVLFTWLVAALVIPLIRSYLDVSIILTRYFINVLPVVLMLVAIAIVHIGNKIVKLSAVVLIVIFSLLDLFIVRDYYNTTTKTQLRELTNALKEKNMDNTTIVTYWFWILPHFYGNTPVKIEAKTFTDYIKALKDHTVAQKPFWITDFNAHPYALAPEEEAYLLENFYLRDKIEFRDAWANYYVPKNEKVIELKDKIDFAAFSSANIDEKGNMVFYNNTNARTSLMQAKKGKYNLIIEGNSLPDKPIKNENAHLKVRLDGNIIGDFFLSENQSKKENVLPFEIDSDKQVRLQIIYDNDGIDGDKDRNVIIYSIRVERK
ncbi:MAG TPA: glycosyltransferase family 39 protein [Flavobacterium sp.]|nr:glycosyltransferase family 39 protein [Flavobacterium sp.]